MFGYGSLTTRLAGAAGRRPDPRGFVCDLIGFGRRFGVAMDNGLAIPGYKRYVDAGGARPALLVAFLDVEERPGAAVNGLAFPVDAAGLRALDARERNYARVEVTGRLDPPWAGRVWTYVGSEAGRARLRAGLDAGRAVVSRDYLEEVERGFAALGAQELERFRATTEPLPCPVRDLVAVDLPPAAEGD